MRWLATALLAILVVVGLWPESPGPASQARPAGAPFVVDPLPPAPASDAVGDFEKGMVFGLFARHEPSYADDSLQEMQRLGVTSVSIMIPWVTPHVRSLTMAPRGDMTPTDASLERAIRAARRRGMSVLLMPFLYVDRMEAGEWRGALQPPDWPAWFDQYGDFILHYARLAQREGVEYLSIGSELCSTEARSDEWSVLIDAVRAVYRGKLLYSSNWDHLESVGFAQRLDVLGMNAYFKLSDDPNAPEEHMVAAWEGIRREVETWRRGVGLDIILTEVGYPSRHGAGIDPWNYDAPGAADLEIQARCYRAFRKAWEGAPHVRGVYFYLWWGAGGAGDTGYTPRGKPAEQVIRQWFGGQGPLQAERSVP
jgi:hypothetical protein